MSDRKFAYDSYEVRGAKCPATAVFGVFAVAKELGWL